MPPSVDGLESPAPRADPWRPAFEPDLRLVDGEVLALKVALDVQAEAVGELCRLLSPLEVAHADRFRRPVDRERYVVRRARLRQVLAALQGEDAAGLTLEVGSRGKPALTGNSTDVRFNVSHSGGLALMAFTRGEEVGVDLENGRRAPDARLLAERFFTATEAAHLAACPPEAVEAAFFSLWTRKEAVVKCLGEGLHLPLDAFELAPLGSTEGERVVLAAAPRGALWVYPLLQPSPGAVAALAFSAPRVCFRCLSFGGAA